VIPLSLLFVLASLGLLVWGLLATSQVLVWGSLGASVAAGLCLSVSVLQRRGREPVAEAPPAGNLSALPVDVSGPGLGPPVRPPFGSLGASDPGAAATTSTGWPPSTDPPERAGPAIDAPTGQRPGAVLGPAAPPPQSPPPQSPPPPIPPPPIGPTRPTGLSGPFGATAPPPTGATDTAPERPLAPPADLGTGTGSSPDSPASATQTPTRPSPPSRDVDAEPAAEEIPVGAALRAAQLDDEVLVVDGRPRYHLAGCPFLAGRPTVPLPLSTARRSGFTPCGMCRPDATLLDRASSQRR
jgi:hypothetical protein